MLRVQTRTLGSNTANASSSGTGLASIRPSTATVTAACCSPASKFFTPAQRPFYCASVCIIPPFLIPSLPPETRPQSVHHWKLRVRFQMGPESVRGSDQPVLFVWGKGTGLTFCEGSQALPKSACPAEQIALAHIAQSTQASRIHAARCHSCGCALSRQVQAPHPPHIPAVHRISIWSAIMHTIAPSKFITQHLPMQLAIDSQSRLGTFYIAKMISLSSNILA